MPKVSVIVPTHNRVHLIERAVRSALNQTLSDLEVLVIDDASTDGTGEVIRGIGDPRVKYLRHDTNRGVSAARNTALGIAAGRFIAFLDDDDEWLPEKLRLQLDGLEKAGTGVGLITTGYQMRNAADGTTTDVIPRERGRLFESMLRRGFFSHTSTVLAKAECFEKIGLFDVGFRYGEDFDMWLRIAREYEVECVSTSLVRVQRHLDYDAIVSGREAHLEKYRDFFEANADVLSQRLRELGTDYCLAGQTKRGRRIFYRAIARCPLAPKSYLCAALSLLGPRTVRFCYRFKDWCATGASMLSISSTAAWRGSDGGESAAGSS
jgi:glycosyltransferase involved in cell wall biosynthesis